jgi:hypothetical protein
MLPGLRRITAALSALLLGYGGARAAEDAVLLASTAPGYGPGMVIAAADRLLLPDGASVTLLLQSGQMLRLRGPLETSLDHVAVAPRNQGSAVALAEALRLGGVDASVIGGTRATVLGPQRPRAREVTVDVQRSGTYCIGGSDTIWLVRPMVEAPGLTLRRRGNLRTIGWPKDAARIEWPADVTIEDGDRFEVLADGRAQATLTFRTAKRADAPDTAAIAEGILLGCREQYESALRRLARTLLQPELWLSSDRGRNPLYRAGEPIGLTIMADTDGWLYCVTERSDGTAMPVFPAGAIDGARWPGALPAAVPGARRSLAILAGPPGRERISCWLADRDIGPELPHALLAAAGERLPDRLASDIGAVFNAVSGSRIAHASLDIRVK